MYDKFGEMGSAEELNELAENLKKEGDLEGLKTMAEENGIPADYVELFQEGAIPYLCDTITAANGKLDVESKALGLKGLMLDWVEYIRALCLEKDGMAESDFYLMLYLPKGTVLQAGDSASVRREGQILRGRCSASLSYPSYALASMDVKEVEATA